MLNKLFYILIGIISALFLTVVFYYTLALDSSIYTLIQNTKSSPFYLFFYGFFTFGAIILFGINISFLVYKWKNFGFPKLKNQTGTGIGSIMGVFASACPVCGSTILSLVGITSGLAAFPFQGLELKALSFGFLAFSIFLSRKEMLGLINKKKDKDSAEKNICEDGSCEILKYESKKIQDIKFWLLLFILIIFVLGKYGWSLLNSDPIFRNSSFSTYASSFSDNNNSEFQKIEEKVVPQKGYKSKISLNDSILKLIKYEVIDPKKFEEIYSDRGGLKDEFKNILEKPSYEKIILNKENAYIYVNLLWPLGLSNYLEANLESPIKGDDLFNFASTGGWTLGKKENGGEYFNKFKIVELTKEQDELVSRVAKNIFRPCCGNSAFFQDCNHGSAILGLLALGVSQGLNENELYKEALAFNSFWFSDTYFQMAVYFEKAENIKWQKVDPKLALSKEYSSSSGFKKNIYQKLKNLNLLPQTQGSSGCGV